MSTLNITARQFQKLVRPVLPHAGGSDAMPVLNSVRIEMRGDWLVAVATDRFRVAMHRIQRPTGAPDDWAATIPLSAVKGIFSTFAPRRGMDADLSLVLDGDGYLAASAAGALVGGFFDASFRWSLETAEFPNVFKLVAKAIANTDSRGSTRVNMEYLSDFKAGDAGAGLWIKNSGTNESDPLVVTDGENFIGLVMPRRNDGFPALDEWTTFLAPAETKAAAA